MFISHFIGIFPKLVIIAFYFFIADIYSCVEARKIYIDPVWILGLVSKECGIPEDVSIYRIFKGIGKSRQIETLVGMGRKVYSEISAGLWRIVAVAGNQNRKQKTKSKMVTDFEIQEDLFII
jgi:hypothetical protein